MLSTPYNKPFIIVSDYRFIFGREGPTSPIKMPSLSTLPTEIILNICKFITPCEIVNNVSVINRDLLWKLQKCGVGHIPNLSQKTNTPEDEYEQLVYEAFLCSKSFRFTLMHTESSLKCVQNMLNWIPELNVSEIVLGNVAEELHSTYVAYIQTCKTARCLALTGNAQLMLKQFGTLSNMTALEFCDDIPTTNTLRDSIIDGSFYVQFPNLQKLKMSPFTEQKDNKIVQIWNLMPEWFANQLTNLKIYAGDKQNDLSTFPWEQLINLADLSIGVPNSAHDLVGVGLLTNLSKLAKLPHLSEITICARSFPPTETFINTLSLFETKRMKRITLIGAKLERANIALAALRSKFPAAHVSLQ